MDERLIEIKREELYEKVWSQAVTQLSKYFGLSDVGLSKTCHRHKILISPRAYW